MYVILNYTWFGLLRETIVVYVILNYTWFGLLRETVVRVCNTELHVVCLIWVITGDNCPCM